MNHVDVVVRIKAELEAKGVSLVGPCGAFSIVKRVAWELRGEGAGLLSKPGGNKCEGFAVDIICYPDGRIIDILANGGGDEDANGNPIPGTGNVPTWNPPSDGLNVDPSRYRKAIDPGDVPSGGDTGGSTGGGATGPDTITDWSSADRYLKARVLETFQKMDAQQQELATTLAANQKELLDQIAILLTELEVAKSAVVIPPKWTVTLGGKKYTVTMKPS